MTVEAKKKPLYLSLETDEELRRRVCGTYCGCFSGETLDRHAENYHDRPRKIVERG